MTKIEAKSLSRILRHYTGEERLDYVDNPVGHIYEDLLAIENFLKNDNQLNRCPCCGNPISRSRKQRYGKKQWKKDD